MLPSRATLDDVTQVCVYLSTKPTGATNKEVIAALGEKYQDPRKVSALKAWTLVEEEEGRFRVSDKGRRYAKSDANGRASILGGIIRSIPAYLSVIERVASRKEPSITATDVAAHWHDHFRDEASDNDKILNEQAVCFFQVVSGANLGTLVIGRRGSPTRLDLNEDALKAFTGATEVFPAEDQSGFPPPPPAGTADAQTIPSPVPQRLGQAIFVAHGKNKKPLEQLKSILDQFKIPYKVAVEEPNLGRPIGAKVKEIMDSCNCAILIFTADEEFRDKDGNGVWRPSQNVVYELGAAGYLYGNRIVIMKEEGVEFPSDFRDIGYIPFIKDQLATRAMEILKELIGFGIVKVST